MKNKKQYQYDVALSFAGEQRAYVEQLVISLKQYDLNYFYDYDNEVDLWGKNLIKYLGDIYFKQSKYCVIFISEDYYRKNWTIHESESAEERNFLEHDFETYQQYILPVRFDDTDIPGIRSSWGYIDANNVSPQELAEKILQKVHPAVPNKTSSVLADDLENVYSYVIQQIEACFALNETSVLSIAFEHLDNHWMNIYQFRNKPIYVLSIKKVKITNIVNELVFYNGIIIPDDYDIPYTAKLRYAQDTPITQFIFHNYGFDTSDLVRYYNKETLANYLIANIRENIPARLLQRGQL